MRAITDMRRRNLIRMITRNRSFNYYTMLNSIGRKKHSKRETIMSITDTRRKKEMMAITDTWRKKEIG